MDWTTIFTCIMSSITTIAVAVLGLSQSKQAKQTAEYKKLSDQLEAEKQAKLEAKAQEDAKRLESIEKSLKDMKSDVEGLKSDMSRLTSDDLKRISDQLSHLHTFQTDNFEYMQSLSNVVLTIGEALNDADGIRVTDKEKIAKNIEEHKKVENKIHTRLYSIIT